MYRCIKLSVRVAIALGVMIAAIIAAAVARAEGIRSTPGGGGVLPIGHGMAVNSVAFSPDSRWVASASDDRSVKIWDASRASLVRTLVGHSGGVNAVVFAPNGTTVFTGGADRELIMWDAATGRPLRRLEGHRAGVNCLALTRDGALLASGGDDGDIRLWNAGTGLPMGKLTGGKGSVDAVTFAPDGRMLASAGADKLVRVWRARSAPVGQSAWEPVYTLSGHKEWVKSLSFEHNGTELASASIDGLVRFWDMKTGAMARELSGVRTALFGPAEKQIIDGSDGLVRVCDAESGKPVTTMKGHTGAINALAVSPDGRMIASAGSDMTVRIWDRESGAQKAVLTWGWASLADLVNQNELEIDARGAGVDSVLLRVRRNAGRIQTVSMPTVSAVRHPITKPVIDDPGSVTAELEMTMDEVQRYIARGHVPAGAFIRKPVKSSKDLAAQLGTDRIVLSRYERLFGMPKSALQQTIGEMKLIELPTDRVMRVYYAHGDDIGYKLRRVKRGTPVFALPDGTPALVVACGNPLLPSLTPKLGYKLKPHEEDVPVPVGAVGLAIPVGTYFVSRSTTQNMVALTEQSITLTTDEWVTIKLSAACANMKKATPNNETRFDVKNTPDPAELAPVLKALRASGEAYPVRQAAVWIVTDNADYDGLALLSPLDLRTHKASGRMVKEYEAAMAMKLCADAGIDLRSRLIWRQRGRIADGLAAMPGANPDLVRWMREQADKS